MSDTRAIGTVPLSIAFAAGGLAVVNPCGFPLLPACLAMYLGADEGQLPAAPTRVLQGLIVGALVALGFLGFFALAGLPVSFGLSVVADAVPWLGLAAVALLALVGASVGTGKVAVFAAYGSGMAIVLMALAVTVACARQGLAGALRPMLPYVGRVSGALLTASGAYLVYYWARVQWGESITLADDPIVGLAARYSAELQGFAERHRAPLLILAGALVALALMSGIRHLARNRSTTATRLVRR